MTSVTPFKMLPF